MQLPELRDISFRLVDMRVDFLASFFMYPPHLVFIRTDQFYADSINTAGIVAS